MATLVHKANDGGKNSIGLSLQNGRNCPLILGIDPGTQVTGWGLIDGGRRLKMIGCGVIRTPRGAPLEKRLNVIYSEMRDLIKRYSPAAVAVEDTFVGKNPASALKLGQARGVILLAAERTGTHVESYSPRMVKSSTVGNGSASKKQVQFMVQRLLNLTEPPAPIDASDALAVAICHFHRSSHTGWLHVESRND